MTHSFAIADARIYGINAAVVLYNIMFWIAQNRANRRNYFDGRFWTYNSVQALSEQFPYLTPKQIRSAIEVLKKNNVILTGNYSDNKGDRSLWYALVEEEKMLEHLPYRANGLPRRAKALAPQGKSSLVNTDIKPDDLSKEIDFKKEEFKKTIAPFVEKYGRDMCNAFFRYWSETSKSGRKLKWEMEDTWEVGLRLIRWKENDDKKANRSGGNNNTVTPPIIRKPENLNS